MSKNEPTAHPITEAEHGLLVDSLTAKGAEFIQGDNAGRLWVKLPTGTVVAITAVVPQGPLPDLSGKSKTIQAKPPTS